MGLLLLYFFAWGLTLIFVGLSLIQGLSSSGYQIFLSTFLVLGMPHGTVDAILLFGKKRKELGLFSGKNRVALYLLISALYALLWFVFPKTCLSFFFVLTAFHWGTSEFGDIPSQRKALWYFMGCSRGVLVVVSLFTFSYEETLSLLGPVDYQVAYPVVQAIFIGALISHLWSLAYFYKGRPLIIYLTDLLFALLLLSTLPPLISISVYYTCFHAIRVFQWFQNSESRKALIIKSHLLSFVALIIIILLFSRGNTRFSVDGFAQASLIPHLQLLAILTLPHAILSHFIQRRESMEITPHSIER